MPNWCANHIEITGPEDKINKLYMDAQDGFLESLAPLGKWDYNDAISQWGTKWEVDINNLAVSLNQSSGTATLAGYFDSAWSPPTTALETFLENNPECEAELYYYEPAMDFCGNMNNNITISDVDKDFFSDDPVGQELDLHFDIIDMLEQDEEYEQEQALSEPPDTEHGFEFNEQHRRSDTTI